MATPLRVVPLLFVGALTTLVALSASADIVIQPPAPTLTERIAGSSVVVRCRLVSKAPLGGGTQGTFEVVEVVKGKDELIPPAAPGQPVRIKLLCPDDATIGGSFLYVNWDAGEPEWNGAVSISAGTMGYIDRVRKLPQQELARATAIIGDIENFDGLVADDVVREFSRLKYTGLMTLRDQLSRAKLVAAIEDPAVPSRRRGEYLRLLSVCGTKDDLPTIRRWLERTDPMADAVRCDAIAAYIVIGGEPALAGVEDRFLKFGKRNYQGVRTTVDALRLVEMNTKAVRDARLLASYKLVLDYPPHAQLVATDLVRHKDWATLPQLVQMYRDAERDLKQGSLREDLADMTKSAVVMFLIDCPGTEAKARLEEFKLADPKLVQQVLVAVYEERSSICPPPWPEPGEPRYPWWTINLNRGTRTP